SGKDALVLAYLTGDDTEAQRTAGELTSSLSNVRGDSLSLRQPSGTCVSRAELASGRAQFSSRRPGLSSGPS
ncbi:hypothetical protein, partial [Nocardia brasiliensis]|uniref:hypothetical protein n=1 Tax=Nocardia brasiliensis TaxID=37326 RepID=UPI0024570E27